MSKSSKLVWIFPKILFHLKPLAQTAHTTWILHTSKYKNKGNTIFNITNQYQDILYNNKRPDNNNEVCEFKSSFCFFPIRYIADCKGMQISWSFHRYIYWQKHSGWYNAMCEGVGMFARLCNFRVLHSCRLFPNAIWGKCYHIPTFSSNLRDPVLSWTNFRNYRIIHRYIHIS
jgi:hypothetical protein